MLRGNWREALGWGSPRATACWIVAIAVVAALLLAAPGQTVSARYLNDLMMFLDGAHRIVSGQVPHRDFHTPMGAVTNGLPAIGLWLTGSLGAAMPTGVGLLILALAPMMAYVLTSRLRPAFALPMAVYLSLILAAPANLGESPGALSFAMFFNRIGWAALSLLLILFLPPRIGPRVAADGICAAALTLLMLYTKASFGLVAAGFLACLLLDHARRPWAALALAATAAVTLALEAIWRLPSAYAVDLAQALNASGAVRGGIDNIMSSIAGNLLDWAAFAIVAAAAAVALRDWRLLLFLGFCGAAGLIILNQNFQGAGIVTLAAGAVVAAEAVARRSAATDGPGARAVLAGICVMLLVLLVPMAIARTTALATHVALASTKPAHRFALPRLDRIVLADTGTVHDATYTTKYVETLDDGARALSALGAKASHVTVLDFVNAFTAGLGLPPPRGDYSVSDYERTFDRTHHLPAETVLQDARIVMEPKWPLDPVGLKAYLELYAPYLASHFALVRETPSWRIYARQDAAVPSG
jgi:hypothetical protein